MSKGSAMCGTKIFILQYSYMCSVIEIIDKDGNIHAFMLNFYEYVIPCGFIDKILRS